MRVVLDANIYISSLISSKGNPATIINRWLSGGFDVLVSQPIVDEILRVTGYERLQKKY
jgi:putative PIN family toxin of toxin-antitoxin system